MEKKATVLIATGTMNAGGAETLIMEILRQQTGRIKYIMLIHYAGKIEAGVYDEEIKSLGIPIVYIPSVGSVGEKRYTKELEKILDEIGHVDIIHSHLNGVSGIIAKAAKKAGINIRIAHCHADITFRGNKLSIFLNELKLIYLKWNVNQYANYYWACSEAAGKRLFAKEKKFTVIPNVIDVNKYLMTEERVIAAKKKFQLEEKYVLGCVGRIARIKNYELVIHLLAELKEKGKMVDFICFGRVVDEQYFKELIQLAETLQVDEQLHFLGNSTDVSNDIGCFDVFLMPSHSEGFGMAAIEAQAAGIPTLVSTGVPNLIDVELGLIKFLPTTDVQKWGEAVLNQTELRRPDHNLIISKFDEKGYNSKSMVRKMEDQYIEMKLREEHGIERYNQK